MSVTFAPPQKGRPSPSPAQIQKMLDENSQLIQGIVDYQNKGKATECLQYQQILHRNLVYLASIADAVPSLLPPPPQTPGSNPQITSASEPSPTSSPSGNSAGATQQYLPTGYPSGQNQAQHPPYNNMQNTPAFPNDMPPSNYSAPTSQGNFGPNAPSSAVQPSQPVPPQQQAPPQQQPPQQQTSPQQQPPSQQQQIQQQAATSQAHASPPQEFPSNTMSQTTVYNQPATTTAQSYTSHTFSPQTQSYAPSGGPSQWYQSGNSQNSMHPNFPASQDYSGPPNHSFSGSVPNQTNYNSNSNAAPTTQSQNFPASSTSPQVGFPHHPPPSTASQESNSSPTPMQQNRFPTSSGSYPHSGYMHYRPSAAQQPSMGPPSGNVHRPAGQSGGGSNPQGQNYNYEQSQSYSPYQPQ